MAARYELTDTQWAVVTAELPPQCLSRPRRDDWLLWNALLWILCTGAAWRDLLVRYGPWQTAYERFRCWSADGTFERVLATLRLRLDQDVLLDLDTWLVDSTTVRATKSAAGGTKKSPLPWAQPRRAEHQAARGVRRGGHAAGAAPLGRAAPRRAAVRAVVWARTGASPPSPAHCRPLAHPPLVAPTPHPSRDSPPPGERVLLSSARTPAAMLPYTRRNVIERFFDSLKEHCRVATRYDKHDQHFLSMVLLASIRRLLQRHFSDTT